MEDRWRRVTDIFEAARGKRPDSRARFLDQACAGDPGLREEIESLLQAVDSRGDEPRTVTSTPVTARRPGPDRAVPVSSQRLGSYLVVREIGRGGMGAVYLAVRDDGEFKKRVAIKLLRRGMDSDDLIERFRQERQILASLDHDGIARLLDGGTTPEGRPYLVMEYVEGQPFLDYCDQHRLSIRERLELFRQVCTAVHYAHQNLVVHRDLKPSNVLVTARGVPKLLDFGIAKLLNPDLSAEAVAPTRFDLRAMTPEYASPEQIRGLPVTTATDVYSLGVMLYELVTGHRPYRFQSRTEHEIARIVCEEEPERPSTAITRVVAVASPDGATETKLTPDRVSRTREGPPPKLRRRLLGDIDNIVLMAMRKEPRRRYGSVEQFSEDIRRHLDGLPVIARPDTVTYRLGKFVGRNRAATVAGVVTLTALVAGVVGVSWQALRAERERARAERRFDDVRRLANSFLFEIHDAIENLPGSTPARALVVQRAKEYLDSLAAESEGDSALQLELATAYARVGIIQWNRYYSNLGDVPGALATQKRAHEIRSRVATSHPDNREARRDLARSEQLLGDLLVETGDVEKGLAHYQRALSLRETLAAESPGDRSARFDVAVSHQRIGDTLGNPSFSRQLGDPKAALESYEAMQGIFSKLALEDPKDASMRHSLSIGYEKLGDMMRASEDWEGALAQYREATAIRASLSAEDPTNVRYRRDLAIGHGKVGNMLDATGDSRGAAASYESALELFRAIAAADPSDANARADLAAAKARLAQRR